MNTSQLKDYAPAARRAFIAAVSAQAGRLGITAKAIADAKLQGDVLLVGGQAFPRAIADARKKLVGRVQSKGFDQTMEAVAYTWFNRFVAIRYMELHGYLDHGYRVLSHPEGDGRPEILDHAVDVDLPGLDSERAVELKLDGTKDEELYRLLLLAQCNALHQAMPFLFERIGDETELLLPANLLHTDSLVRQLVESIDEGLWAEIEIIGWLYQFYISEKKAQVIGRVVKSEDIPAATQLFTPNWIVKYMVQNSLGAQWLATYPQSPLKGQMEYYIEPAGQTDEVKAQLAAITPKTLDPETLTLIDPACGSGHILVEAYELFKAIYLERGYRQRDVAHLILEKNLFGLDIDERAAQLTGFALMMKARGDDRRLFERGVKLNVMALVDSAGFDAEGLAKGVDLWGHGLKPGDLTELKRLFAHATTLGSLVQLPEELAAKLPALKELSKGTSQDLFVSEALKHLGPLVHQAELLAAQYDAVVANPPYIGRKYQEAIIKDFAKRHFRDSRGDCFAMFITRAIAMATGDGRVCIVAPYVWMFLSSYERFREKLLDSTCLDSLIQLEYNAFEPACIPVATFTLRPRRITGFTGSYINLSDFKGHQNQASRTLEAIGNPACGWFHREKPDSFRDLPGSPVAYWVGRGILAAFRSFPPMGVAGVAASGIQTSDNDKYLRRWFEVDFRRVNTDLRGSDLHSLQEITWIPHHKGGAFRRWFGNCDWLLRWDFAALRSDPKVLLTNMNLQCAECVTWSHTSSSHFSVRFGQPGSSFNVEGPIFIDHADNYGALAFLASSVASTLMGLLNPTLHFSVGNVCQLPYVSVDEAIPTARRLVALAESDWDTYERSWGFRASPFLSAAPLPLPSLESTYTAWITQSRDTITEMKRLEEENNRLFIDAYGLADELSPDVPIEQVTLSVNPAYRYRGKITEEEQWTRFRKDSMEELVSYAIGCLMGRYSLDAPGLIYAHSGNDGFDPSRYATFPADADGIVPLTDSEWFDDDACHRLIEFLSVASNAARLEDNLTFLADNLSPGKNESSRETLRRYFCDSFFKDHLQTYKKRPIYWLFSSGKQKAFQAVVYLHRYNEGTLSRMRSEYVIPLQGKMAARLEKLRGDIQAATSTSHRKRLTQERVKLEKQQAEMLAFDEKLRHYADMRITLDLDDGVKVNYGKFGDLLAEVKTVTGGKADDE